METILSPRDRITEYFERYQQGEMTWEEFQRFEANIQDTCPHYSLIKALDEDGITINHCTDCGSDL